MSAASRNTLPRRPAARGSGERVVSGVRDTVQIELVSSGFGVPPPGGRAQSRNRLKGELQTQSHFRDLAQIQSRPLLRGPMI